MSGSFFEFDLDGFLSDIEKAMLGLDVARVLVTTLCKMAMDDVARQMISAAQVRLETQTVSGDLSRSALLIEPQEVDGGKGIIVGFGFTAPYAAQRDRGGVILPKNGRCLAIPLEPVLTGAGRARYDSPLHDDGAPNGLFLVRLWGKLFLAQMIGKGKTARIEFRWLLVPSVTQEGSFYFSNTIYEYQGQIGAIVAELVKQDLKGAA